MKVIKVIFTQIAYVADGILTVIFATGAMLGIMTSSIIIAPKANEVLSSIEALAFASGWGAASVVYSFIIGGLYIGVRLLRFSLLKTIMSMLEQEQSKDA